MSDQVEDRGIEVRAAIRKAMEDYADAFEITEGGKVTTFVCVAEVVTPDDNRALIEMNGAAMDDASITTWVRDGLLFNALHDEWFRKSRDDE